MGETEFLVVKNRAYSTLLTAIDDDDVSVVVAAGEGARFPSTYPFDITIEDEIMRCTNRATDTLTVTRAQQSTTAVAHSVGVQVSLNITAKSITDLNTAVNFIEKYADYGLAFYGVITTIDDTTHFRVAGLAGMGTGWFKTTAGTPYEILVVQADGAAPEGQQTPVVAYTSTGGIFQHAAFSGGNPEVGDEVLIINPLLASLGTKATAAATGAVTTTDYMMAYVKQLVTELQTLDALVDAIKAVTDVIPDAGALTALLASIASILEDTGTTLPATLSTIDTVVDGIQTDLSNATDGLGALKALIDAVQTDVGDPTGETLASISAKIGDIARSLDVIIGARWDSSSDLGTDIAQLLTYTDILDDATNGLANIKSLIDTLTTNVGTVDTVVDGIQTDLSNVTDGLGALRTLILANATLIGALDATATADDLSDIATTDIAAKVGRLLLRFSADAFSATIGGSARTDVEAMFQALANYISDSGGAYSVSLDGSARTDIEALHAALAVMLGTRDQTVSAGVLADTESAFALLRRLATSGSLVHFGDITAVSAGVSSTIADLIGWEDDYFLGWWMMIVRDDGGAGAAPQGEYRQISSYTSTTGLMNHTAFSAADVVGDQAMLIHPLLYGLFAATRGSGVRSLETLGEDQDAGLDVARGKYTKTMTGAANDLYGESSDAEFVLQEFRVDLHNMAEGDTIVFKVLTTEDGTERQISDDEANTFVGPQDPARVEIIGSANQVWGREDISITATQTTGTNREIVCYWRDAKRGS